MNGGERARKNPLEVNMNVDRFLGVGLPNGKFTSPVIKP